MPRSTWAATAAILGPLLTLSAAACAGTLEDLERERAQLIHLLLDPGLPPPARETRLKTSTYRLVDLERRVLRDQRLVGAGGPVVKVAFDSYDLTFLVHASAEKGVLPAELWLDQLGLSGETLAQAKVRKR